MKTDLAIELDFYPPEHLIIQDVPVLHGFFGRNGGVSKGDYETLNCGYKGDLPENILENHKRVAACFGMPIKSLMLLDQIHGGHVVVVEEATPDLKADAMVTKKKSILLGIQTADCVPILLYSPSGVIGAVHGGWKSLSGDIIEHTIKKMVKLGAEREEISALIGPCIRKNSYEVGTDFYDHFLKMDQANEALFSKKEDRYFFDISHYAEKRLIKSRVSKIFDVQKDTYTDEENYFSRRRSFQAQKNFGSQLSVIMLS